MEGAALAVIVVFLFLRDWRATLIAAVALPLSVLPTFWAMDALGFTLNGISLLAITLVTGILVDDAIVVLEHISRRIRGGEPPLRLPRRGAVRPAAWGSQLLSCSGNSDCSFQRCPSSLGLCTL